MWMQGLGSFSRLSLASGPLALSKGPDPWRAEQKAPDHSTVSPVLIR